MVPDAEQPQDDGDGDCDCLLCSSDDGDGIDSAMLAAQILDGAADLLTVEDPLFVEIPGAIFTCLGWPVGGELVESLIADTVIPKLQEAASPEARAVLLALAAVAAGRVEEAAVAAALRLQKAGVAAPSWAGEIAEPVLISDRYRLFDPEGRMEVLAFRCVRADRSHAFAVSVDPQDCGAAMGIAVIDGDQLGEALDTLRAGARAEGLELCTEEPPPGEFRWYVETALAVRTAHELDEVADDYPGMADDEDSDEPPYPVLAALVAARMTVLGRPARPASARVTADHSGLLVLGSCGDQDGLSSLPSTEDEQAQIYQLRVDLRGAKPPIWRRLEVPADTSLSDLHEILQIAFGWDDAHLHAFETPYGPVVDAGTGRSGRSAERLALHQVAPTARSRLRYTYDFGDDWEHDIVVEKITEPVAGMAYPRCTGGRRAAPPEDCGGVVGYEQLLGIAAVDPTAFSAAEVDMALADLR